MIDWTKPVETVEDPPRPVRVLATDLPPPRTVALAIEGASPPVHAIQADYTVVNGFQLRNVPAKPVLHERWVNLYDTYSGSLYCSEKRANSEAGKDRVECRRIVWNSDGSPVERDYDDAMEITALRKERDDWKARAEALQASRDEARQQRDDASRLIDRMRPVVDAAVKWADRGFTLRDPFEAAVFEAVRAYQDAELATSDSHEAVVDEVIDIWRKLRTDDEEDRYQSYIRVKNCTTCRWCDSRSVCGANDCLGDIHNYRGWEAKS